MSFNGAGGQAGVEVWRVEKFELRKLPDTEVGVFFEGDSYVVLHTYCEPGSEELHYAIYFWLGAETSSDEWGTAAIKAVELDDHLGGMPVQCREVQGAESEAFLKLFPKLTVRKGGVESGFTSYKAEEHKTRLLRVAGKFKQIQLTECTVDVKYLNNHDVFVLDAGKHIFQFNGDNSNVWERRKGGQVVDSLQDARQLPNTATSIVDGPGDASAEKFWMYFGGKQDVPDTPKAEEPTERPTQVYALLPDLSEAAPDALEVSLEALRPSSALLVDTTYSLFVWGGHDVEAAALKRNYLKVCEKYIDQQPTRTLRTTPIVLCFQGHESDDFVALFA